MPDIVAPDVGASIQTVGGMACTVTVTLYEPVRGGASLSVAVTVMV
jgi:hypothetical protein